MKVIKTIRNLLAIALVAVCGWLHAEDPSGMSNDEYVLWWFFDETTEIKDINGSGASYTIDTLVGRGEAAGKTVNGIRVAAYNGDTRLGYLDISDGGVMEDGFTPSFMKYYPVPTTDFDSGADSWSAGPTYAKITSEYTSPSVSFMIELGSWDDTLPEEEAWTILAHSDAATMADLRKFNHVGDLDMQGAIEWTGGGYSVPEPSSGLLLLIGGALLSLRRRRRMKFEPVEYEWRQQKGKGERHV